MTNIYISILGASFASAIFIGREIGQAEYRYIERFNNGKREGIPIFAGVHPKVWNKLDPYLWITPAAACAAIAWMFMLTGFDVMAILS